MIIGIDEVGRGCFAGPMIIAIAACTNPSDERINALNDSKKLSEKKRKEISLWLAQSFELTLISFSAAVIDHYGLNKCYAFAKSFALDKYPNERIIIDGNFGDERIEGVIKADAKYIQVMAASIAAKVYRDEFMMSLDDELYGFKSHKGYGTKAHIKAIKQHGLSKWHRKSFCKNYIDDLNITPTSFDPEIIIL